MLQETYSSNQNVTLVKPLCILECQDWCARDRGNCKLLSAPASINSEGSYFGLFWPTYEPCLKAWAGQERTYFGTRSKGFGCKPAVVLKPYGHISSATELC